MTTVEPSWPPAPGGRTFGVRQIGVILHPTRDLRPLLSQIGRWGRRTGVGIVALAGRGPLPGGVAAVPVEHLARHGGVLLALGGDRTMLHALAMGAAGGIPVLGVRLGHVDRLAEVEAAGLPAALDALAGRRFAIEERTVLTVRNGDRAAHAAGDVVLRRASAASHVDVVLHVGGEELAHYRGDGLVVATPTGSTGRSVVSPRLAATIVTPLAERGAPAPVLLSAGEPAELEVRAGSAPLVVEIDGRPHGVARPPARLRIDQSAPRSRLIRLGRPRFAGPGLRPQA